MPGAPQLSRDQQWRIIVAAQRDKTKHRTLARQFHVSRSTITRIIGRWRATGEVGPLPRPGRPHKLANHHLSHLRHLVNTHRKASAEYLSRRMRRDQGISVSTTTIKRARRHLGFVPRKERLDLRPTRAQVDKRRAFARAHRNDNLRRWLFADECYVGLRHTGSVQWVERGSRQPVRPIVGLRAQFGVFGAIGWNFRNFRVFDGYPNSITYAQWMKDALRGSAGFDLAHDLASYHRSIDLNQWL